MNLNLEEIKQISFTGIRRAYAFMGLGINAANNESFNDYNLSTITKYNFLPTNIPIEEIKKIKIEFADWIISNGFREFLGSFEVYLDNIHFVYLNILTSKKGLNSGEAKNQHLSFKHKGVIKKIESLQNKMNFKSDYYDHIKSLNIARNCFAHRRGIVEKIDINNINSFQLTWLGLETYIQKFDGSKLYIFPPNKCTDDPKNAEKGEQIKIEWKFRSKEFPLDCSIKLTPIDISEILSMMGSATNEILKIIINQLKDNSVTLNEK